MFCKYCGKELSNDASFCSNCGKKILSGDCTYIPATTNPLSGYALVAKFSERVKTNAIIWIIIGAIQILLGLYVQWVLIIVGVLNIITAISDISYSKKVLESPKGIVKRVDSLVSPVIILIYNIVFGGVIGIAGSIYYFVAIRGFVMENKQYFKEIEDSVQ